MTIIITDQKNNTSVNVNIITNNQKFFDGFDKILIYYDNGQRTLGVAIKEAFSILGNYEQIDKFNHTQERPFQNADLLTFIYKYYYNFKNKQNLSNDEIYFFQSIEMRTIRKGKIITFKKATKWLSF